MDLDDNKETIETTKTSDESSEAMQTSSEADNTQGITFEAIALDEVVSDNTVLKGYIDQIRNKMNDTNFFSKSIHSYTSTTKIPNEEVQAVSQFFQATGNLLSVLKADTESLLKIGLEIEKMDEKQAEQAFLIPEAFQIVASGTDGSEGNKSALDSMTGWDIAGLFARNMAAASLTGAVVGTAVPVIGNLVGAVGGLIVGIITSAIQLYALSKSPEDVLIEGYHTV